MTAEPAAPPTAHLAPITVACSPDADDLFMMWALLTGRVPTAPFTFVISHHPTDALNAMAGPDGPDVLAISIARYPAVWSWYQLLPHGGSLGEGYGPVLVAAAPLEPEQLRGRRVAIPGLTTTAWTVLRMLLDVEPVVIPIVPYERVFSALRSGEVDAALIIHEGRLTFEDEGFVALLDLGEWWAQATEGLPLPLGGNAIHRRLGPLIPAISGILRESIAHALEHRDEVIDWLLARQGPLGDRARIDRYLSMYANARTLDYGREGRLAVELLLEQASTLDLLPEAPVDWAPAGPEDLPDIAEA